MNKYSNAISLLLCMRIYGMKEIVYVQSCMQSITDDEYECKLHLCSATVLLFSIKQFRSTLLTQFIQSS
jgi:hypothetical protein